MGFLDKLAELLGRKPTPAVQDCPLAKGIICVVVSREDKTDTGIPDVKVSLSGPSPGSKTTDANGIAQFDDRTPGSYEFGVLFPSPKYKDWTIAKYSPGLSVTGNQVTIVDVMAHPTGTLVVEVRDDSGSLITNAADLSSAGVASLAFRATAGTHTFKEVACGKYVVTAQVAGDIYERSSVVADEVTVPEGGTATAKIVVNRINLVTPHVDVIEKEGWFTPPPPPQPQGAQNQQAQQPADNPPPDTPAQVKLRYTETLPAKPFKDGGTVTFTGPACSVFRDKDCKVALALDQAKSAKVSNGDLAKGLDLYVKGKEAGAVSVALVLDTPKDTSIRPVATAQGPVELNETNVVEPKIECEYKLVLLDPDLAKHQDAKKADGITDEEKIVADDVIYIQVSAKAKNATPKYTKGGKLEVTTGADKVKIYTDMRRTKLLDRPLTNAELVRESPFILYVVGAKEGDFKLKLTLDPSDDPHIVVKTMKDVDMAVVKLDMKLHQYDESALANETFPANKDTLDAYFAALKDKVIPQQKEMTDQEQVKPGRMLHVQKDTNHGRARLLLKKITATWPAEADEYYVVLSETRESGGLELYDKDSSETTAAKKDLPFKVKVKDLKTKDVELWVEAKSATKQWRDIVLDMGIDRDDGGLVKEPKHNGDWARFTAVQVKEVKLDYTPEVGKANAWDSTKNQFYVNLKTGEDGRKIKLAVELSEKLKDIPIHFMLAPHKDNGKNTNWGINLPSTWKWKDIDPVVKHRDRASAAANAPLKLLHLSKQTDANGKVDLEVNLSRFGGDVFEPGAYITQDPHLAKYVKEHPDLKKRKPVVASHTITVWRKFWYREVKVEGINNPPLAGAIGQYERVRTLMDGAPNLDVDKASISGGPAIYARYMIRQGGGSDPALVVSDLNRNSFFASYAKAQDRPLEMPILICDAMLRHNLRSGNPAQSDAVNLNGKIRSSFPLALGLNCTGLDTFYVVKPCVNSVNLVAAGTWKIYQKELNNTRTLERTGNWVDADIDLVESRAGVNFISIKFPSTAPTNVAWDPAKTYVDITGLVIRGARSILGISTTVNGVKVNVAVYDPSTQLDRDDFHNTIVHELAHAFGQVPKGNPANGVAGVPAHPNQADEGYGNHCRVDVNKCVMYDSGPIVGAHNRFCDECHPYLLVQDFSSMV